MLTIAGSDSIGGAGIQADIKTASALGVYSMSIITAITAQNTLGVSSFEIVSPKLVEAQLHSVLSDVLPDAVKIGMLPNAETIRIVSRFIRDFKLSNVVVDPVMVATSSDKLYDGSDDTFNTLCSELLPLADIITPNIPEAEQLCGEKIYISDQFESAAKSMIDKYKCKSVLLKGGHLCGVESYDLYFSTELSMSIELKSIRTETANTHGTGCSLSSAIASELARNKSLVDAVINAKQFISEAIREGAYYSFGHGHGPINHLYKIQRYDS